jgi:hypothetical protein
MDDLTNYGDQGITVQEAADQIGCSPETVKQHIRKLWPELMQNGKATYLAPAQVTVILEKMKQPVSSGAAANLQFQIAGIETSLTPVLQLKMLQEQMNRIYDAELTRVRADNTRLQIKADEHGQYITVKRVAKLNGLRWDSLDWKRVKRSSQALELDCQKADDLNYGTCNAYHIDAWRGHWGISPGRNTEPYRRCRVCFAKCATYWSFYTQQRCCQCESK